MEIKQARYKGQHQTHRREPGFEYWVMVAAEMDFYPKYLPWAFVTPSIVGAREDGKVPLDLAWDGEASSFVFVLGAVVLYIEGARRASAKAR
jgi:hypothetical protein